MLMRGGEEMRRPVRERHRAALQHICPLLFSVHDFQQPLGIWLEHDEIASDFGFEFIKHGLFRIDALNEHSNS